MAEINFTQLSKTISLALRHKPEEFSLILDEAGWVDLDDLLHALRARKTEWSNIDLHTLEKLNTDSEKKRFEIEAGRIRAYYGHSVVQTIEKTAVEPPAILYHGTTPWAWKKIQHEGLLPMNRQYVHLSAETDTALNVGERRTDAVVLLRVDAQGACNAGIQFYHGNETTWLADAIPSTFLKLEKDAPLD